MDIPHARELPKPTGPDNAAVALAQWLHNQGPIVSRALLNRKDNETEWYFPCRHEQYRAGQAKIASYMHERGYIIQWCAAREGRYADPNYGTQGDIPAREEGFRVRMFSF